MYKAHKEKFEIFVDTTEVDFIAFETITRLNEVEAVLKVVQLRPGAKAWIAVICKDGKSLVSGETIE